MRFLAITGTLADTTEASTFDLNDNGRRQGQCRCP
jgi:hypothetical protein